MNYLDLTLLIVIVACIYRGATRGGYRPFISLLQNAVAIAIAVLCQGRVVSALETAHLGSVLRAMFEATISIPTGPGFSLDSALLWLREADLPHALSEGIRLAWTRDSTADIVVFTQSAGYIIAKAALNLMCLISLFLVARWLVNILSGALVKALPIAAKGRSRAFGVTLGIIESMAVAALIVAIVAPLAATTILPHSLVDAYRYSRLAKVFLPILRCLGSLFYGT